MGKEQEIFLAARTGNTALLEKLFAAQKKGFASTLRKSLRPNIQDEAGYTPLHHATLHGHKDTVTFLLQCQASTQIADSSGSYPLHLAAWKGDLDIVKLLVEQGPSRANVNQQSNTDDTALHLAAQYGHTETVEYLLQQRADAMLVNVRGETPLDLASLYGRIDAVNLLVSHCPELLSANQYKLFSPLHLAARNGHVIVALSIINAGQDVNSMAVMGSALHEAAMYGKIDIVKLLLDKNIDLTLKDQEGCTVLQMLDKFTSSRYEPIKALIREAEQHSSEQSTADGNSQSDASIPSSHSAHQLSSGGQVAQERRDRINYQYLMMAIPQSDEKKRFSLGQRSNSGLSNDQQQIDSFLQDSWCTDKPPRPTPERQLSSVTIDPGDLAADSKSLRKGGSHDYQNVSFDEDEELKSPGSRSLRFSRSLDPTSQASNSKLQSENSKPQSTDPFLCDSWAAQSTNTIAISNPSKVVSIVTNDKAVAQSLPEYENVWCTSMNDNGNHDNNDDDDDDDDGIKSVEVHAAPLQIDFGDLIEAIDDKIKDRQQQSADRLNNDSCDSSEQLHDNHNTDDYHDYHKGPIKVQSQPIQQRSDSIVLSSGSHADPVSGDPDYENYGSDEDYANVFDTPTTPANQKSSSAYDRLELKSVPKHNTLSGRSFSLNCTHDEKNGMHEGSHDAESHKLVENTDNPFAGLVMTASSMTTNQPCHDDLTRSMARSVIRRSNASCLDNSNRESYWSSDRVEEEFDQIDSVLEGLANSLQRADNINTESSVTNVYSWLGQIGMAAYTGLLESNGYDCLAYCGGHMLDDEALTDIGVTSADDRSTIVAAAQLLPACPDHSHITNLSDWLNALSLSYLEAKLIINGYSNLKKLSQLQPWDIELLTSLGVGLIGHRKRLALGISQLKSVHSDWSDHQNTTTSTTSNSATTSTGTSTTNGAAAYSDPVEGRPKPLRQKLSNIAIRPPKVAQQRYHPNDDNEEEGRVCDSLNKPVYERDSWVHGVDELLRRSVHYHVKYLGSVILATVRGVTSTKEACHKLKASTRTMHKIPEIILSISWKGIKFIDGETKNVISEHSIHNISYSAQDPTDQRVFAYITKETGSSFNYCHVFMVHDKCVADEVVLTIGQAFEVAYQKMMKARAKLTAAAFEKTLEQESPPAPPVRQASLRPLSQSLSQLGLGPAATASS